MWELEDSAERVEAAFVELVEKRKDVMEELVRSSMEELTKTPMNLLVLEKVILSKVEREELMNIKGGQKQEYKKAVDKLPEARQEEEKVRKKGKEERELAETRGEITPPNTPSKKAGSARRSPRRGGHFIFFDGSP